VETNAKRLTAFDVDREGRLSGRRLYADIGALVGPAARPDGIWAAADGIWVATLDAHVVVRVREGKLLEAIETPALHRSRVAFATTGALLVTVADTHGQPLMEAVKAKSLATSAVLIEPSTLK